ncbi:MAG: hypothetical protein AB1815_05415 [Bacillota bacterium]|jgi:glucose uptake protein GlcU
MRINNQLIKKEFLVAAGILLLLWSTYLIFPVLYKMSREKFQVYPLLFAQCIGVVIFGMLLATPSLINRWNKNNGFNWIKFVIQGIPAFLLGTPTHRHLKSQGS